MIHNRYPLGTVAVANLVSLSVYVSGAAIMTGLGYGWLAAYLAGIAWLEYRVLSRSCVDCAYYGKRCAFGKGVLCGLLFGRGDPRRFSRRTVSWKELVPDMAVAFVPLLAGVVLLVVRSAWAVLVPMAVIVLASSAGNAFVRGKLACLHCRQRLLGCPAERLFRKAR